ncbi:MAG: NAD(P)/FAD-dependent oxidoreductase [Nitrososphaeria archaeon]
MNKRLAVIGGGYAGVEVLRQLLLRGVKSVEASLFTNKRWFENTIGGPELISGKVKVDELKYDLKTLSSFWNFELHVGTVGLVDLVNKFIKFDGKTFDYDIIVLASGSQPNFYNVIGHENVFTAYSLEDFMKISEMVSDLDDGSNIVVVGAGFVGLEVVGELLDALKFYGKRASISVVELANSILSTYPNEMARGIAFDYFSKKGVKFVLGQSVKLLQRDKVVFANNNSIESDLTLWAAGIKSSNLSSYVRGAELFEGYIKVDERLIVEGSENAFSIGDMAFVEINGRRAQKMAGEALEQAKTVAKNIEFIVAGKAASVNHEIKFSVDFPQALLSVGDGKAMLIFGQDYASLGNVEYFLKKRIDFDEIMERFPKP